MKRIMVFLLTALWSVALYAQDNKDAIIYLNGGSYFGSHNNMGAYYGVEYNRQLNGNWYWGARLSGTYFLGNPVQYDWDGTGKNPYRNTIDQNIYKADAIIYYRLPVIKDIVLLRPGAGFGIGYHEVFDEGFAGKDKVIPYLNASLNWIVKCSRHLEFVLSPTIALCPSEFDYSFVQLGGATDINPWLTNYFVSLGIGYRF